MEITKDVFYKIAQHCDPTTRANWMMAYPGIFKSKEDRDYVRMKSALKYAKRWRENTGYWRIFWNRIPDVPIHKYTRIEELFPEFEILKRKPLYRLLDMPLYNMLVSPIMERCYHRRKRDFASDDEKQQILMGMICKYYMSPFIPEDNYIIYIMTRIMGCTNNLFGDPTLTDSQIKNIIDYNEEVIKKFSHSSHIELKTFLRTVPYRVVLETLL